MLAVVDFRELIEAGVIFRLVQGLLRVLLAPLRPAIITGCDVVFVVGLGSVVEDKLLLRLGLLLALSRLYSFKNPRHLVFGSLDRHSELNFSLVIHNFLRHLDGEI